MGFAVAAPNASRPRLYCRCNPPRKAPHPAASFRRRIRGLGTAPVITGSRQGVTQGSLAVGFFNFGFPLLLRGLGSTAAIPRMQIALTAASGKRASAGQIGNRRLGPARPLSTAVHIVPKFRDAAKLRNQVRL